MNRKLRIRAEAMLIAQEFGTNTDPQTLAAAVRIAHHDNRFQVAVEYQPQFGDFARSFRELFPRCPCRRCLGEQAAAAQAEAERIGLRRAVTYKIM